MKTQDQIVSSLKWMVADTPNISVDTLLERIVNYCQFSGIKYENTTSSHITVGQWGNLYEHLQKAINENKPTPTLKILIDLEIPITKKRDGVRFVGLTSTFISALREFVGAV